MYVDFKFYKNEYGGKVTENDFNILNIKAQAKVDYFTFNRIPKLEMLPQKVKFAVCEVIDTIHNDLLELEEKSSKNRRITSETTGSHSVSFKYGDEINKSDSKKTLENKIYEIVVTYLMNEQNLMYRGVNDYDYRI
ncbi:head-tail connector protein [Helcococcus kunzii]|uniref:hypothetical protein n=1 Tax=Helcococcus kunzii TaxID=40091 RepID=UPI001BAF7694|nr:hypothetical protein [Helcococcus kunzii]QUY65089.1 hypothetical protein GUI37_05985 [Helcococcus kunzii]